MERIRDIPIGCPLDQIEPVFVNGEYDLTRFEWLCVDILEQEGEVTSQDVPDLHRLYDGPHLYPLATVQFLILDGFLKPLAKTRPYGWAPLCTRPAVVLRKAFETVNNAWHCIPTSWIQESPDNHPDQIQSLRTHGFNT